MEGWVTYVFDSVPWVLSIFLIPRELSSTSISVICFFIQIFFRIKFCYRNNISKKLQPGPQPGESFKSLPPLILCSYFYYWTLDGSWAASYEITFVRLSVCQSLIFLKIGSLVFSDIVHDDSRPWSLVTDGARFLQSFLRYIYIVKLRCNYQALYCTLNALKKISKPICLGKSIDMICQ